MKLYELIGAFEDDDEQLVKLIDSETNEEYYNGPALSSPHSFYDKVREIKNLTTPTDTLTIVVERR